MWPPHSVNTWSTPACFRTRATSWPPVRSATRQPGHHLRREALDLLALLRGGADRVEDDVVAAGGAKALDRLHALLGGADDPVLPREGLEVLHGLRVDRHALEIREAPLERRGRVAPQRAHDVDRLAHARAALGVRHAAQLELLRVLAADADAEDETPPGQHVERRGDLGGDRGRPQREQVDGGAKAQAARDRHVASEQRERLVHRIVEGHVVARPHTVEAERLDASDGVELLLRRLERELDAEAQTADAHRGKASLTPPSTVSVQPVVLDARSEARNSTASATSSGRMRAPSRLRLR